MPVAVQPGDVFGELLILSCPPGSKSYALCRCSCGVEKSVRVDHLRAGKIISCGHERNRRSRERLLAREVAVGTTHGLSKTRAYTTWLSMMQRCYNPNNTAFHDYGGRGISVCERWHNFEAFAADMGQPPVSRSLDRIDNDGDYSPGNCRWATKQEQQENRRSSHRLTINGVTKTLSDWAKETGIPYSTIQKRASLGWPGHKVIAPGKHLNTAGLALGGKANGARQRSKTHCKYGHPFDAQNTYFSNGFRQCLTCHRERERVRRKAGR